MLGVQRLGFLRGSLKQHVLGSIEQPDVDPARSGFLGTCVGGAFGLMAAADPRIRDRVAFVAAYAPYASMWTLARDIAFFLDGADHIRPVKPSTIAKSLAIGNPADGWYALEAVRESGGALVPPSLGLRLNMECPFSEFASYAS